MSYIGDFAEDYATLNFKFTTRNSQGDGVPPFALASGVISVYKGSGTSASTAGITLAADFNSVTGLNNVLIDLSADAFYATGQDYHAVITTGTVNSISVVGEVVAQFSIENRSTGAIKTDTAAILVDTGTTIPALLPSALVSGRIDASVGAMASNVITGTAYATTGVNAVRDAMLNDATRFAGGDINAALTAVSGTSDSGTTTTMVDSARSESDDDYWNGAWILFTSGNIDGQCRRITNFVASTDTITFEPATTQAVATQTYEILPGIIQWTASEQEQIRQALGAGGSKTATASGDINTLLTDTAATLVDTGTTIPALLPSALVSGRIDASLGSIEGTVANATNLGTGAGTMVRGTVDTTAFTATTTIFESDDVTTAAADHYNKRTVAFTSGTLQFQAREIEDYVVTGGRGRFTVSALTSAPANNVTFVIY